MSLMGLVSQNSQEDVVVQGSGLSRGDKRRNAKLARLRELVPTDNAILGIDLADEKQAIVLTGHDSQVLVRMRVNVKAWRLAPVLEWGREQARKHGFADVTVGCEPTGHRWLVLDQLAAQRDMTLVCVQPLLTGQARQREDYTRDKTDDKDAVLIARLVAQLNCYAPERADETWARLRHLGARRDRLISESTACIQQLRDLLECAWPAVLAAAAQPFDSLNWCAALAVVLDRCNGDPRRLARLGPKGFEAAVRRELPRWGGQRAWRRIIGAVFTALTDPAGVAAQRRGALERARWVLDDWRTAQARLAQVQARMVEVLDELGSDRLPHQHPGPLRSRGGGHLGRNRRSHPLRQRPCPGQTRRAVPAREHQRHPHRPVADLPARPAPATAGRLARGMGSAAHNPVMAARYQYLTTRERQSDSPTGRPERRSRPRCCAGSTSSSPDASPGMPPSPAPSCTAAA